MPHTNTNTEQMEMEINMRGSWEESLAILGEKEMNKEKLMIEVKSGSGKKQTNRIYRFTPSHKSPFFRLFCYASVEVCLFRI